MNVLILGGCGYIGSRLTPYLKEHGHDVETVDLEWFGNYINPANHKMDFRDLTTEDLAQAEIIVLIAGHSSVPMCKDDMLSSFRNNVINFVELLGKLTKQRLIYASSSSVYGNTQDIAAPEDWQRYDPKTFYDLNKQELDYYARLSPVESYGLRFGTVNGHSLNQRVDIMLNKMYQDALEKGTIEIFNKHIFRPILGIQDLCRAIQAIIEGPDRRGVYNLASFNASVEEIAEAISRALDGQVKIVDKGISPTYNFSINTNKFKLAYHFEFQESVESIVRSLKENWDKSHKTVREGKPYV